jgi:predicted NAD/FAD-binding protein
MGGERGLPPCRTFGGGQPHYSAQQHYEPTSYRRTPRRTTHSTATKTLFCALFHLRPFHHDAPANGPYDSNALPILLRIAGPSLRSSTNNNNTFPC